MSVKSDVSARNAVSERVMSVTGTQSVKSDVSARNAVSAV